MHVVGGCICTYWRFEADQEQYVYRVGLLVGNMAAKVHCTGMTTNYPVDITHLNRRHGGLQLTDNMTMDGQVTIKRITITGDVL